MVMPRIDTLSRNRHKRLGVLAPYALTLQTGKLPILR